MISHRILLEPYLLFFFCSLPPIYMPEDTNNGEVGVESHKNLLIIWQVVKYFILPKLHRMCLWLENKFNKTEHIDCQREDFFPQTNGAKHCRRLYKVKLLIQTAVICKSDPDVRNSVAVKNTMILSQIMPVEKFWWNATALDVTVIHVFIKVHGYLVSFIVSQHFTSKDLQTLSHGQTFKLDTLFVNPSGSKTR